MTRSKFGFNRSILADKPRKDEQRSSLDTRSRNRFDRWESSECLTITWTDIAECLMAYHIRLSFLQRQHVGPCPLDGHVVLVRKPQCYLGLQVKYNQSRKYHLLLLIPLE